MSEDTDNCVHLGHNTYLVDADDGTTMLYAPRRALLLSLSADAATWLKQTKSRPTAIPDGYEQLASELGTLGLLSDVPVGAAPTRQSKRNAFEPTHVSLLLTGKCNLRCVYCYSKGGDDGTTMRFDVGALALRTVVDNARSHAVPRFSVSLHGGGEPTVVADLLTGLVDEACALGRAAGVQGHFSIGTNGVMNTEMAHWITRHIHEATVSIDGPASVQDRHRPLANGSGSHDRLLRTLAIFDDCGFQYAVRMTVTDDTVEQLPDFVGHVVSVSGAKTIMAEPVFLVGRALASNVARPDEGKFIDAFRIAAKVAKASGRTLGYSGCRPNVVASTFCAAAGGSFCVTPSGRITACYEVTDPADPRAQRFHYGQVDPECGRIEIDEIKLDWLAEQTVDNVVECCDCFTKWHCGGDCLAKTLVAKSLQEARPMRRSFRCAINRELMRLHLQDLLQDGEDLLGSGSLSPCQIRCSDQACASPEPERNLKSE